MEKSKVAVVACPDYEPARVKESLQKGLEAIGGLESLIGKEENILLKPNLVRSAKRERAVVTDPEVMDALITILQENGYEGAISVEGYHDPYYSHDWEMTGQLHAMRYLKWCRGRDFTPNPW